ncbi:hypothetical protein OK016_20285 [Vibrio chagasii]|nr:hypothetical protein [Vibrio chagasii]
MSWYWKSARNNGEHQSRQATYREQNDKGNGEQHWGFRKSMRLATWLRRLKTFTPVGTAINMVQYMKNSSAKTGIP